jgi:UDP-N-acetylglucosamine:LPS N-acetylglucosamine transferase
MDDIRAAATATPDWDWDVIGPEDTGQADLSNLRICGWVDDVWPRLLAADVVVTHAGQNAIAEVAAARLPAIVVPQDRPFGEQRATAAELEQADIAVVSQHWPAPSDWRGLLDRAIQQDGHKWELWSFGDAGERAAKVIEGVARSS